MFSDRIRKIWHTLAFRLTVWYALVFVLSAFIAFSLFYILITSVLQHRIDETLRTQRNEFASVYALQGVEMLERAAFLYTQAAGEKKMFYRLFYPSGVVFSSSNMIYWRGIGINRSAIDRLLSGVDPTFVTHQANIGQDQVRVIYARIGSRIMLQLGYAMTEERRLLLAFKQIFAVTMSGLLILAVLVGWFMARRALAGIGRLTQTARKISENDLETRVPVYHRHTEIDLLAVTFNQMLDRIRNLVTGTRQMNDNIAHDLRSPITRIRGLAEVTLTQDTELDAFQQMAASTIEECDRLLDMINTMLTISRTESGESMPLSERVDLSSLVDDACELFQPLADDHGLTLASEVPPGISMAGNQALLQRMVANLVDNSIKYTPSGGRITVQLTPCDDKCACLTVTDTGQGIDPADQSRIFERFYRGDRSRSQSGAGLGLSLAQAIAKAHKAEIAVESHPEQGSVFRVRLPMQTESQPAASGDSPPPDGIPPAG